MNFVPVVGYDAVEKVHRPLVPGAESVDPRVVPLSAYTGNKLTAKADGLYIGDHPIPPILRVNPMTGTDTPPGEALAMFTCKTLDYALSLIEMHKPKLVTLLLLANTTHSLSSIRVITETEVTLGFYDDVTYPTIDYLLLNSRLHSQYQSNLVRPVIISNVQQDADTNCWYMSCIHLKKAKLKCKGVQFNIPSTPAMAGLQTAAYSTYSDMIRLTDATVDFEGVIANKLSADSNFGLVGVESRSLGRITGYATQLLVENSQLSSAGSGTTALANRAFFLKLLPDWPGNDTLHARHSLVPSSLGPTPSSAILDLQWTLNQSMTDAASGGSSLATFPNSSTNYGIGNYIYGIVRDTQRRPLNVRSNLPL